MAATAADPIEVRGPQGVLRGETSGEGPTVVLAHGLTATRRYVIHGSRALERAGYRVVSYDARGHGQSEPAADGVYDYPGLAEDLAAVIDDVAEGEPVFLAGHSMGAHTIARICVDRPDLVSAAAVIGPAYDGTAPDESELTRWQALADGLERGGVDGFMEAYGQREWPGDWRETALRITRERIGLHEHPAAVAEALRQIPASPPLDDLAGLETISRRVLVVASHDDADPEHPYAVAEDWAQRISGAELVSEEPGESPLAWQGGKLSRRLAAFFEAVPGAGSGN